MKIKICGFTNAQNANQAAMLGIDAIGLVFYDQSPRNVGVETALQIVNALPPFINRVGLFVNADSSFIDEVLCEVPLILCNFMATNQQLNVDNTPCRLLKPCVLIKIQILSKWQTNIISPVVCY